MHVWFLNIDNEILLIAACIYADCQGNELFGHNGHSSLEVTEQCLLEVLAGTGSLEETYDDIITYVVHSRVTEHTTLVCKFWTCANSGSAGQSSCPHCFRSRYGVARAGPTGDSVWSSRTLLGPLSHPGSNVDMTHPPLDTRRAEAHR